MDLSGCLCKNCQIEYSLLPFPRSSRLDTELGSLSRSRDSWDNYSRICQSQYFWYQVYMFHLRIGSIYHQRHQVHPCKLLMLSQYLHSQHWSHTEQRSQQNFVHRSLICNEPVLVDQSNYLFVDNSLDDLCNCHLSSKLDKQKVLDHWRSLHPIKRGFWMQLTVYWLQSCSLDTTKRISPRCILRAMPGGTIYRLDCQ